MKKIIITSEILNKFQGIKRAALITHDIQEDTEEYLVLRYKYQFELEDQINKIIKEIYDKYNGQVDITYRNE